uniref:Uncharacterized protein n=1 Tax=Timema shepardi TaxID=629360 RepID=A0A7R9AL86_TIMSH|nr:unnamed protein product [Timema shepardi]
MFATLVATPKGNLGRNAKWYRGVDIAWGWGNLSGVIWWDLRHKSPPAQQRGSYTPTLSIPVNCNAKGPDCGGMYSEWASLSALIQNGCDESQSVLGKLPMSAGREVALSVVKQLASNLGIVQPAESKPLGL